MGLQVNANKQWHRKEGAGGVDLLAGVEAEEEGPEEADRRAAMGADTRAGAGVPIRCRCSTPCISLFYMSL